MTRSGGAFAVSMPFAFMSIRSIVRGRAAAA
jgi:hypothetical protein